MVCQGLGKWFPFVSLTSVTSVNGDIYRMLLWPLQTILHSAPSCGSAATGEFGSEKK